MAIKAKDQVTIIDMTDVSTVITYYLLQLTTLTPPTQPTVASPTGWTTTEPTYNDNATYTLYTCVKTTFTNATFMWGEVNVSSTYESAKAAYNKAQTAVDGLEPGALTTNISNALGSTYSISNAAFGFSATGITVYNGALTIKNTAGTKVFYADTAGNLTITGSLNLSGTQVMKIMNNATTPAQIGYIKFQTTTWEGNSFDSVVVYANTNLDMKVGDVTNGTTASQIRLYAGTGIPVMCGQFTSTGTWFSLETLYKVTGNTNLIGGSLSGDSRGGYPVISATGANCNITISPASWCTFSGEAVYDALTQLVTLHLQLHTTTAQGSTAYAGTIPLGYRPTQTMKLTCFNAGNGTMKEIQIDSSGRIALWNGCGSDDYMYFDTFYHTKIYK